ncbi:MAG TPA: flippase [Chloroflexaceae bacterium]|nr:flippase [Chloroflexaceae bacterium]
MKMLPRTMRKRLQATPLLARLVGNTSWLFGDRVVALLLNTFTGIWLARYLGPEQFGFYSFALAFVALIAAIATIGVDGIVTRDLVNRPASAGELLGTSFGMRLAAGLAAIALAVGAVIWSRPADPLAHAMVAIVALTLIFRPLDVIDVWFQARLQARYAVVVRAVTLTLMTALRVGLILMGAPLVAFAWAMLAEVALTACGLAAAYLLRGQSFGAWRFSPARAGALLREGWPLIVGGVSVTIYMRFAPVLLGQLLDNEAVGLYAVAQRLSETTYFIPTAIMSSLTPALIAARQGDRAHYLRRVQRVYNLMVLVALAITVPASLLAAPAIALLFGAHYAPAGPILSLHVFGLVFVGLGVAQSTWDINEGFMRANMLRTVGGALVNVALNLLLIPRLGGVGAAIATVAAHASAAWLLNLLHPSLWPNFRRQTRALLLVDPVLALGRRARI